MSVRESLHIHHLVPVDAYLRVLRDEFNARPHPEERDAFLVGSLPRPFYRPLLITPENTIAILGFNLAPLPPELISALARHPELAPPQAQVIWTIEQELLASEPLWALAGRLLMADGRLEAAKGQPGRMHQPTKERRRRSP